MYEEETAAGLAEEEGHAALLEVSAEGLDLEIREPSGSEPHGKCASEGEGRGEVEDEDESEASWTCERIQKAAPPEASRQEIEKQRTYWVLVLQTPVEVVNGIR
ncbi:hypothetical protein FAGAP_546 [Fusarium agapanthi]|uniref:Uncharacterized protein n=1 Tax=Fusarium agapanthi TaxID=1803897 RepID=A0A9P5BJI1_9HYPO|nr:hypothetical protein FAGAP_546 [Fusarium agapanthi]